jgi:hypothetical protein
MKNLAVKVKNAPPGIIAEMDAIMGAGTTAAISQSILKRRSKLELPELPKANLDELQKIFEVTGAAARLNQLKEES